MRSSLPTGTVTFLFTDIEDSTRLAQQYPAEYPALLERHHAILRQAIETHRGTIFQIVGDAFCAAFFTLAEALAAALQAQRELQQAASNPAALSVRVGIHTGPAQAGRIEDPTGGYTGYLTLTRFQRVMAAAHGGQVLLSSAAVELLRAELPEGVELRDMGEHCLKGLLHPERLWQASAFPGRRFTATTSSVSPAPLSPWFGQPPERSLFWAADERGNMQSFIGI